MHPILAYCERLGITQAEFGRRAEITPGQLGDVIHGRSYLGREAQLRVVRVTGGEVTLADLATWEPAA